MKLRERKQILMFLEYLMERIEKEEGTLSENQATLFSDDELIEMILWLYSNTWTKDVLERKEREELLGLVGDKSNILLWVIERMEQAMTAFPTYTQEEADDFFQRTQNESHYLNSKPLEGWDEYDFSNYRSLLLKTGSTKRVYAIFTSDVLAEDVYAVTTQPSYFFDTRDEAKTELQNIVAEGKFAQEDLVIHSLWLLTQ